VRATHARSCSLLEPTPPPSAIRPRPPILPIFFRKEGARAAGLFPALVTPVSPRSASFSSYSFGHRRVLDNLLNPTMQVAAALACRSTASPIAPAAIKRGCRRRPLPMSPMPPHSPKWVRHATPMLVVSVARRLSVSGTRTARPPHRRRYGRSQSRPWLRRQPRPPG
jgi:hypothetical protein